MNLDDLVSQLEFKYPQLKRAFGTINTFIDNLLLVDYQQAVHTVVELLNFKGKLIVIDPVQSRFTLYDEYDNIDQEAVIYEKAYSVYNFNRELLYSVSSHYGMFGNAIVDSLLTIDYKPGSLFYLDYYTYQARKQIILVTGLLPIQVTKPIKLTSYNPSSLVKAESFNQISLKVTTGSRDMSKPGLPYYPVKVYYLPTNSPVLLSKASIVNSTLTQITEHDLEFSNQLFITPKESGWLALSQVTSTGEVFFDINNIEGTGIDRLVNSAPNLYYLAVDSDINMSLFKQAFNLDNVSLPNFDNYTGLDIKADLSNV